MEGLLRGALAELGRVYRTWWDLIVPVPSLVRESYAGRNNETMSSIRWSWCYGSRSDAIKDSGGTVRELLRRCLIGRRRRTELDVAGFSVADVGSGRFSIRFEVLGRPFSGLQTHY